MERLHLAGPRLLHDSRRGSGSDGGWHSPEFPPSLGARARERCGVYRAALGAMSALRGNEEDDDGDWRRHERRDIIGLI
jgi:hypothetical protein